MLGAKRNIGSEPLAGLFPKFHVPIGEIEEMLPAIVILRAEIHLDEWPPFRPLRLADQVHARFDRSAIRLPGITPDARAHDIFPSRRPPAIPRHYVIEVQILTFEQLSAVLAGVLIALEDVVPCEFHLFLRHPVKEHQHNDSGNPDAKRNRGNALRMRLLLGNIVPLFEVVRLEGAVVRI